MGHIFASPPSWGLSGCPWGPSQKHCIRHRAWTSWCGWGIYLKRRSRRYGHCLLCHLHIVTVHGDMKKKRFITLWVTPPFLLLCWTFFIVISIKLHCHYITPEQVHNKRYVCVNTVEQAVWNISCKSIIKYEGYGRMESKHLQPSSKSNLSLILSV